MDGWRRAAALRGIAAGRRLGRSRARRPCAAAGAPSAGRCPGISRSRWRPSTGRARSSACRAADRCGGHPPGAGRARRRACRQDLGAARRRHAARHGRAARQGPAGAVSRHGRHDLVEPAALGPVRRHAAPGRGPERRGRRRPPSRDARPPAADAPALRADPHPRRLRRARRAAGRRPSRFRPISPGAARPTTRPASMGRPMRSWPSMRSSRHEAAPANWHGLGLGQLALETARPGRPAGRAVALGVVGFLLDGVGDAVARRRPALPTRRGAAAALVAVRRSWPGSPPRRRRRRRRGRRPSGTWTRR